MNEETNRIDLKPHPKLLAVLLILFFLWIAALLWMYFATVYPLRHPHGGHPTSLPTTSGE